MISMLDINFFSLNTLHCLNVQFSCDAYFWVWSRFPSALLSSPLPLGVCLFLQVTTPLLKFMAEFVLNKAQRLTFDSSSPNGILLFREVSKLIVAYGSRVLSLPNAADIYTYKYKGIWICLTILSRGEILALFGSCYFRCMV